MLNKGFKLVASSIVVLMIGGVFVGCSGSKVKTEGKTEETKISVSGSTSVGPLMEKISEQYESENVNTTIEINQVGSSAGIKDTINGVSEIGMSSRELKDEEKKDVTATTIAYDGIALITHKNNTVKEITLEQVKGIYTGKITNWKEIGGKDAPIVVVSREEGSGTRSAFEEIVKYKSEELVSSATISDGSGSIKTTVAGNENAIGFASFEYLDDTIGALNLGGVKPEAKFVKSGEYKLSRPFILVTKTSSQSENSKKLIDYILSKEGQKIVADNKLITLE
ncbi:phosphate ABC transporter substrate-binding protein [Clostridium gasigenes]|uniref:Phosphate-binding protein n=1 Tax=Clostridium gasigenes TaxID=94869 RepID=A0A1H0RCS6_9CLOT|nr:phosphate ABC transporter substrate-binding protein [Clostridium gasigenes]MBB6623035.1 phosphate ABC transporter substrate-binding protein [Clostridium gasigenes]MBU3087805.1 phosphate ABC transporter substrate-binding protein [Clostridium gasigenes]MBU3132508.1 phosphate ABC transporter substrate-binding protein [Clostridium gasigenes]SDP27422.1 phosphate ABC transporter substrate-binding protein, PhoT family [Clostridium gasigenes]